MSDCVFCKIVKHEQEASIIFQDEKVSAFMDINPISRGHVLVVPNGHFERLGDVPSEISSYMFAVAQKILAAIINCSDEELPAEGANLFLSDGFVAGQDVAHSHLHIVPRFRKDGLRMNFSITSTRDMDRKCFNLLANKIKDSLVPEL